MALRITLGAAGILLGLFGVFRIVTQVPPTDILVLLIWLAAALVLHDGVLSPLVVGVGVLLEKLVPPRARRFVAAALVVGGLITVVALPLIYREDSQPPQKALLRQDYGGNLAVLLGIVAGLAVLGYLVTLVRDRRRSPRAE